MFEVYEHEEEEKKEEEHQLKFFSWINYKMMYTARQLSVMRGLCISALSEGLFFKLDFDLVIYIQSLKASNDSRYSTVLRLCIVGVKKDFFFNNKKWHTLPRTHAYPWHFLYLTDTPVSGHSSTNALQGFTLDNCEIGIWQKSNIWLRQLRAAHNKMPFLYSNSNMVKWQPILAVQWGTKMQWLKDEYLCVHPGKDSTGRQELWVAVSQLAARECFLWWRRQRPVIPKLTLTLGISRLYRIEFNKYCKKTSWTMGELVYWKTQCTLPENTWVQTVSPESICGIKMSIPRHKHFWNR